MSGLERTEREKLELQWLERLRNAKHAYRTATDNLRGLIQSTHSAGWEMTLDGKQALSQATVAERKAMARYLRVLKIFTDLVVDGVRPPRGEAPD